MTVDIGQFDSFLDFTFASPGFEHTLTSLINIVFNWRLLDFYLFYMLVLVLLL